MNEASHRLGSAGEGKISGASRADLAEAAAIVLTSDGHAGKTYELCGTAFTMSDVAAAIARHTAKRLVYRDLPVDDYTKALAAAGLPALLAEIVADTSFATRRGDWHTDSTDLQRLIGRPSTPLTDVVATTLKRNGISTLASAP